MMKVWKADAPPARDDLVTLELLRDVRALLYAILLSAAGDERGARARLEAIERDRMEER